MKLDQDQSGKTGRGHAAPPWAALIVDIINTPEIRQIITDMVVQWLRDWSGNNFLKRSVGGPAAWVVSKALPASKTEALTGIFNKPEHLESLSLEIPTILGTISTLLTSAMEAVEKLPVEDKKALFSRLLATQNEALRGRLLASLTRIVEDIYTDDPLFFSSRAMPLLTAWVEQNDFGELKGLFDATKGDLEAFLKQALGLLIENPAKLIALLSLLPDAGNMVVSVLDDLLTQLNEMPPDVLTELILTLFRQVDAAPIGQGVNRINEIIRQLHTGSTLIGEMDAPRFTTDLRDKIRAFMAQIDPQLTIKARSALIDGKETLIRVLIDAAQEHPQLLNLWLHQLAVKRNAGIRLFKQKLQVLETLPEEETIEALSAGLSSWNAYDLAETVNTLGRTLNRIHKVKPDLLPSLVSEFVNALDLYELEESLELMCSDLGKTIRPVFRAAAPSIIRELCGFFEPGEEDDGYDDLMHEARNRLRRLILGEENP